MVATQLRTRQVLGLNQRQYEALKTSLQLNLRRQLLIAVCDSDTLQHQLVDRLQSDLETTNPNLDDIGSVAIEQLRFDPEQPDLVMQLVHWLKQSPKPNPHLQVLGLEAMTQQSMRSQNHFLRSLENIQALLPHLNSSLVIWVSWPWYRKLEQSAPDFWQWRSGVFTFVGEPVSVVPNAPTDPPTNGLYGENAGHGSSKNNADIWQILSEDLAQLDRVSGPQKQSSDMPLLEELDMATAPGVNQPIDITRLDNPLEFLAQREADGASTEELIQGYRTLGHYYRDLIEAGSMTPNLLATTIKTFDKYLHWLPQDHPQRSAGLNDLGTLHWLQAQHQSDRTALIAGMHRSVELYQQGLQTAAADAEMSSRLYGNLGAVHSALANYDDSVNHLKDAATAYRQALPFSSSETAPGEHGMLQNSLGSVYWKLAYYEEPKSYLQRAIAAYNQALSCHRAESEPLDYAAVQNNIGIAYWSLSRHERPIFLLNQAIIAYRDALNYRTPTTDAAACASTYNNLGTAFWELANHPEAPADPEGRYQQNAVIAYEAALKASDMAPSDLDVASIRHCLGSIYDKIARAEGAEAEIVATHLDRALEHYVTALKTMPKEAATYEPIFKSLVRNVSGHYELLGLDGQKQALGKIPAELLPEVMLKV